MIPACCSTRSSLSRIEREGYTTDDNARALILSVLLEKLDKSSCWTS